MPEQGILRFKGDGAQVPRNMLLYLAVLFATAGGIAAGLWAAGQSLGNPVPLLALALIAVVAERGSVRLNGLVEVSISLLPTLFAAVLFGPLAAMAVSAASMMGDFRRPYMKWAVYSCNRAITGALTGLAAYLATIPFSNTVVALAAATVAGAIVAEAADLGLGLLTLRLRGGARPRDVLRTVGPVVLASVPLYAPIVGLLAYVYSEVSPWTLPIFFVPALAAHRTFVLYQNQRGLIEDVVAANERLERANLSFATALVATLDARDRYTAGHSAAVAIYARDIAARMGLDDERQQLAHLCGLVHDIGKIGLSAGLLEKPGPLTLEERRQMETHSEIGERILSKVDDYAEIAQIVRHHHERVDAQGYPDGLDSDEIPLLSKIIGVADAYNAMTSDRPYRDAMPSRVARLRLAQSVGSQFDTSVVAAFEAILATATESYRLGDQSNFALEVSDHYEPDRHVAQAS